MRIHDTSVIAILGGGCGCAIVQGHTVPAQYGRPQWQYALWLFTLCTFQLKKPLRQVANHI
jgi:hypothetical protein